jgi:hypothetical protein
MAALSSSTSTMRARQMRRVLGRWERSGLTLAAFAKREGVVLSTLAWWRQVFRHAEREGSAPANRGPQFTEVRISPATPQVSVGAIEVVLRSGHLVRVRAGFDPAVLRAVVSVFEGSGPC